MPNPTFNVMNVEIVLDRKVEGNLILVNKLGQNIYTERVLSKNNNLRIDLSSLESGIYFVRFETAEGAVTRKVVKL